MSQVPAFFLGIGGVALKQAVMNLCILKCSPSLRGIPAIFLLIEAKLSSLVSIMYVAFFSKKQYSKKPKMFLTFKSNFSFSFSLQNWSHLLVATPWSA